MTIEEKFDEIIEEEYLEFDRIPEKERRHPRSDLCAFLYLHELLGGTGDMVCAANHDEIYLDYSEEDCENLTEENILYIVRCGVSLSEGSLHMFV